MSAADEGVSIVGPMLRNPDVEVGYTEEWYRAEFPGFPDKRIYSILAQKSLGESKETCPNSRSKKGRKSASRSRR